MHPLIMNLYIPKTRTKEIDDDVELIFNRIWDCLVSCDVYSKRLEQSFCHASGALIR